MVDESLDTASLSAEPQPWEFRAKPAWQRMLVMLGGIIVNLITGILFAVVVIWMWGEKYYSAAEVNKLGIYADSLGVEMGLRTGDRITGINNKPIERFSELFSPEALLNAGTVYNVQRGDSAFTLALPETVTKEIIKGKQGFIEPIMPYDVKAVREGTGAQKAGLLPGDKIVALNGVAVPYFHLLQQELGKFKNKQVQLTVSREGKELALTAMVSAEGKLGFEVETLLKPSVQEFSVVESISKGSVYAFKVVYLNAKGLWMVITGQVSARDSLGGPVAIANMYGPTWDWRRFWELTAMLSMVLAFMNLLPIPALDGGHAMFLTYEMATGRKPSDKFMENAQKIGMIILLSLMAFIFINDILKGIS